MATWPLDFEPTVFAYSRQGNITVMTTPILDKLLLHNFLDRRGFLRHGFAELPIEAGQDCGICLDHPGYLCHLNTCGHHFCRVCITMWARSGSRQGCPMCRAPLWIIDDPVPTAEFDPRLRTTTMQTAAHLLPIMYFAVRDASSVIMNLQNELMPEALTQAAMVIEGQNIRFENDWAELSGVDGVLAVAAMGNLLQWWFTQQQGHHMALHDRRAWRRILGIISELLVTELEGHQQERASIAELVETLAFEEARDAMILIDGTPVHLSDTDWWTQPADYDDDSSDTKDEPDSDVRFRRWMLEQVLQHIARTALPASQPQEDDLLDTDGQLVEETG